jgi:hypothetical protein
MHGRNICTSSTARVVESAFHEKVPAGGGGGGRLLWGSRGKFNGLWKKVVLFV